MKFGRSPEPPLRVMTTFVQGWPKVTVTCGTLAGP